MKHLILIILMLVPCSIGYSPVLHENITIYKQVDRELTQAMYNAHLHAMTYSFVMTESLGKHDSYLACENSGGVLHIRPVMIKEVNHIQDSIIFALNDRFDSTLSVNIFRIVMLSKNKELSIRKACIIWNGMGTKPAYYKRVMYYYRKNIDYFTRKEVNSILDKYNV